MSSTVSSTVLASASKKTCLSPSAKYHRLAVKPGEAASLYCIRSVVDGRGDPLREAHPDLLPRCPYDLLHCRPSKWFSPLSITSLRQLKITNRPSPYANPPSWETRPYRPSLTCVCANSRKRRRLRSAMISSSILSLNSVLSMRIGPPYPSQLVCVKSKKIATPSAYSLLVLHQTPGVLVL